MPLLKNQVNREIMKRINLLVVILSFTLPILAVADDNGISELYKKNGIEGALLIESLDGNIKFIHNTVRAEHRYLPASTFKILNTLIALEEEVIKGNKEIIKWDGNDKGWGAWNKDQTLSTAFSLSCVWCYQEFAKKIGNERYIKYLVDMSYGNKKTGKDVTSFWLEGDLGISVIEQIDFIRKVYLEKLPFKNKNIQLLKKIMLVDETPIYTLSAKTGWANRLKDQHGWYVGYIEVNGKTWLFANNVHISSKGDLRLRKQLVIESLKLKGII